ncbi:MAG: MBL fold metallo-hydrolase [Clostridiales bacterium]|nr:MBL fold metallo-hydrolase [Clostridiales bacterium]MDD7035191.1 MBL fold metallo-hydrolase [Bacillota bacterium]MDY2920037.1 MBL fold metallo-hydrolase [Lentihominibacter sp.]
MITKVTSEKIDGNSYIIREGGYALVIDPADGDKVTKEIERLGVTPEYIILTHEHFDHIGGLEQVRETCGIPVIASRECSDNIQTVKGNLSSISGILEYFKTGKIPDKTIDPFVCGPADITFEENYSMEWRGHSLSFRRLPGHSRGSVLIYLDEGIIFTGDYLIADREVITRLKGGSQEDYDNIALPVLESIPEGTHIYPGHDEDYIMGRQDNGQR